MWKKRSDQWRSPASKRLQMESLVGRFACCHAHFHSTVKLVRSDGLRTITESPPFPHSCWKKGWSSFRDWSPWDLLTRCQGQAGCSVLLIRAQLGTGKATAGLGKHGPKSACTQLAGSRFEFTASITVCLHSGSVLGKQQCRDPHAEKALSLLSLHRVVSLQVRSIFGENENSCLMLHLQTQIPEAGGHLHFSLSAAGGTPAPFLIPVPALKWWVICYGPKGSRKAWPNLTKPEGHRKDFEQNVSDLLALPIPSQLLRANNLRAMAMGERHGEESEKSFWQKQCASGSNSRWIPQCLHKHGACSAGLGLHNWPHSWHGAAAVWHSGLRAGDPFSFNAYPLHPGLAEQFITAPVPQNTCQQVCPKSPKDIMRLSPLSTMVMLPLLQSDVLGVRHGTIPWQNTGSLFSSVY